MLITLKFYEIQDRKLSILNETVIKFKVFKVFKKNIIEKLTRKQLSSFLKINVTPCPKIPKEKLKLKIE